MGPGNIDVGGRIDLIDRTGAEQSTDLARTRTSRLNDVMIVMERDREALERAINQRVASTLPTLDVWQVTLSFHQTLPEFHVALLSKTVSGALTSEQQTHLETEIAAELFEAIDRHAPNSSSRRWQPSVTATWRAPTKKNKEGLDMQSVWFKTLLWLLAAIVLATAYLYLKGAPT